MEFCYLWKNSDEIVRYIFGILLTFTISYFDKTVVSL